MKSKHIITLALITFYGLKFVCLIPFSMDIRTFQINFSKLSIIWCVFVSATIIGLDPYFDSLSYVDKDVLAINVKPETILSKGTYFMVLICVYWAIFNVKVMFQLINLIKLIFENLQVLDEDLYKNDSIFKQFLLNFFVTQMVLLVILYTYYIIFSSPTWMGLILYCHLTNIKYLFGSSVLLKYNFFITCLRIGFSRMNKIISKMFARNTQLTTHFEKMTQDCLLSDEIDQLAVVYSRLYETSMLISKKFYIPILTFLAYLFLVIET